MSEDNLICICGHFKSQHESESTGAIILHEYGDHWCSFCVGNQPFHTFKLDNLKYLEAKYKEGVLK